jgi:nigerose phosphorylase
MWEIKEIGFNKDNIIQNGNKFLTGHMKLGVRGTLDEFSKAELAAINLPLVYDRVGNSWRESVNAYNPLYTILKVNGRTISLLTEKPFYHEQSLNLKDASMSRLSKWLIDDLEIVVESKRFVSLLHSRMICGYYQIRVNKDVELQILTGIDLDIWDLNGPHLENTEAEAIDGDLYVHGRTQELGIKISTYKHLKTDFPVKRTEIVQEDKKFLKSYQLQAKKDASLTLEYFCYIGVAEELSQIQESVYSIAAEGFTKHLKRHQELWTQKWSDSDVEISGDEQAQLALRYTIYHLLLLSPSFSPNSSIPARGISGQTYKGAVFWDTEIFMLPFYLHTDLASAKSVIKYRIEGLKGALEKAKEYGFRGAFYAWESQEEGNEACSDYNVTDVHTNRPVRTYFKDKQIHISADIVYAINAYISHSQDFSILKEGALEVILEVARFYLDYGNYKVLSGNFEIWDVLGPDEYHERVNNNAFTNQMVKMVFETVLKYEDYFQRNKDSYFEQLKQRRSFESDLEHIRRLTEKVLIKKPNDEGIIEQFDGYFKLKDVDLIELKSRMLHPNEYLGGHGLAGDTQIIKQADVVTMLYLFRERYDAELMKKNWDYYEPRTEHGSSLSASMYALVACLTGNPEYAYPLFLKSATVDLTGESKHYAGGIYIGGTHPAASGGAYLTAVYGFAGLIDDVSGIKLMPQLPEKVKSIAFKIKKAGRKYRVFVSKDKQEITETEDD